MSPLGIALLGVAAKEGIPYAIRLIERLSNRLPEGNPTKQELLELKEDISIPFEALVGDISKPSN